MYSNTHSDWSTNHTSKLFKSSPSFSSPAPSNSPAPSDSPASSSSPGSSSSVDSSVIMSSNSTMFQSSSALSRNPRLYTRRYDSSSDKKSIELPGQSSSPSRKSSRTRSDSTDTGMHPAARALNKRASSMERMYPVRSMGPHISKTSPDTSVPETRSSYNRSLSVDRYGRTPDTRRFSSSVDYSTRLGLGSSHERLDNGGEPVNSHRNDYKHSPTALQSSREMSGSSSNIYHQNGSSPGNSSRVYSSDEVEKIRVHYNQEIQDLKLDYQSRLLAKDREWDKKLQASKSELSNSQKMVMDLRHKCNDMAAEYDKSMTELLNDKELASMSTIEPTPENMNSLKSERDQYADDLQLVEKSFTELHKRYDKLRENLQSHKRNEEKLKEEITSMRQQLRDASQNFEKLRGESQDKLTKAANEVEKAKSSCKAELIRLQMALKKSEVHAQSVEQQLKQKIEENSELAQICDNLIALKGGSPE